MITFKSPPPSRTITGFCSHQQVQKVLSLTMYHQGIIPPVFVPVDKDPIKCRTGFYVGLVVSMTVEELFTLMHHLEDMLVDGEGF